MPTPFKIPQSVLVVMYTPQLDVLLIRRADTEQEFWQSVTGSKDAEADSWEDTASREVLEETGIDCRPGTPLHGSLQDWQLENVYSIYPHWLHRYAPGTVLNTERVFGLQLPHATKANNSTPNTPITPITLNPREHTAYQWLPWRTAALQCFSPSNAEAILLLPRFARPDTRRAGEGV
ncbi:MAG: dihydroneopterin triphosphate diphosphatase [Rhodoferax sp.]|nr:dihydroneopterin triphosphate diphosphatase [Rhodoferax sp.]